MGEACELDAALSFPSEQRRSVELQSATRPEPSGATMNEATRRTKPPRPPLTVRCSPTLLMSCNETAMRRHRRLRRSKHAPTQRRDAGAKLSDCDAADSPLLISASSPTPRMSREQRRFAVATEGSELDSLVMPFHFDARPMQSMISPTVVGASSRPTSQV